MKKIVSLLLVAAMCVCFFACGKDTGADSAYVTEKGKLVVGITDFAPMDYQEKGSEEWVGFDADYARAFAESLGVTAEFVVIEWDSKEMELDGKTIDCVWNGMTLTDGVKAAMETSKPYCNNAQIVIVPAASADQYQTAEACKDLKFAVETGSAGKDMAVENGFSYTEVADQATALMEVAAGTCDAAIIDSLMAAAMVGEGTGYANLAYTVQLNSEQYGVGFRKGSDLAAKLDAFFDKCIADGTLDTLAAKYGVTAAIIK